MCTHKRISDAGLGPCSCMEGKSCKMIRWVLCCGKCGRREVLCCKDERVGSEERVDGERLELVECRSITIIYFAGVETGVQKWGVLINIHKDPSRKM